MSGAGTLVCPACGAGVSKADAACPYCGSVVVLPKPIGAEGPAERRTYCTRCGQLYAADAAKCPRCPPVSTDDKGGRCPRCAGDLEPVTMGTVSVDRCRACRGHWFDGDEVEHAFDLTTRGVSREEAVSLRHALPVWKGGTEEIRYLACVRCGERMARRQVAPRAGIIVDICRHHGVWFDGGELEEFVAFTRAGGLEVVRHDGVASAEARRRAETELRTMLPPTGSERLGLGPRAHGDVLRALGSLIDWIV